MFVKTFAGPVLEAFEMDGDGMHMKIAWCNIIGPKPASYEADNQAQTQTPNFHKS